MKTKDTQIHLVGREKELMQIRACLTANRNILLEGPVGVGKTFLATSVTQDLGLPVFRVDGDNRYSEQKLSGWFDPPTVIRKGYLAEAFIPGPLVEAMQSGGVLFINELNRLPEGVQNILLPAIDERMVQVPRLGTIQAKKEFRVIATQNPKEFVATSHLSEAILDRFELIHLDYQGEEEEIEIVSRRLGSVGEVLDALLPRAAVRLIRLTRHHPRVRRGASIRAALSVAEISHSLMTGGAGQRLDLRSAFLAAALMALPTRIEIEREMEAQQSQRDELENLIREWVKEIMDGLKGSTTELKKKI